MKVVPAKRIHTLDGAVVPQLFTMRDGEFYFFDRINEEEGRFCINTRSGVKTILEVGEGQGIITETGEMYNLQMGERTIISKCLGNGNYEKIIDVPGIFFDFKINESRNFVCLGYQSNEIMIKIFNCGGVELSTIRMPSLTFISSIDLCGDNIYIGGFDNKNTFKLMLINYIGNIIKEWSIDVENNDRIIGKIQAYKDYVFLFITGKSNSIVVLNRINGLISEITPKTLGINDFNDFNVYNRELYVLCSKVIYEWDIKDIIEYKNEGSMININIDFGLTYYRVLMFFKGIREEILPSVRLTLVLLSIACIGIIFSKPNIGVLDILELFSLMFWPIGFTIAIIVFLFKLSDKSKRIEYLLDIYYARDSLYTDFALYYSAAFFSVLCLIHYPFYSVLLPLTASIAMFVLVLISNYKFTKELRSRNQDFIIDLLHEDDGSFGDYLKSTLEKLKNNNDRVCIEIATNGKIKGGIVRRWWETRKEIIGHDVKYNVDEGRIVALIDLSERDIKYSRYSILMDYICYIKDKVEIKEIHIMDGKEVF